MAHLWRSAAPDALDDWHATSIDGDVCRLDDVGQVVSPDGTATPQSAVLIRRVAGVEHETWVLVSRAGAPVLINGRPSCLGIVVLADRDEIRRPATPPIYFSTECLATVVPFPGGTRGSCPRCKDAIEAGQAAVRCPACGLWHHAMDERPCWTYGQQCAACSQPTALDSGFRWTPEAL